MHVTWAKHAQPKHVYCMTEGKLTYYYALNVHLALPMNVCALNANEKNTICFLDIVSAFSLFFVLAMAVYLIVKFD